MESNKNLWLLGLVAVTVTSCSSSKEAKEVDERPNILFILSDDHTSQSWGIYGGVLSEYAQNEHIRQLAAEGCVLDNCFCTNSISVPSRASIMTGAYSHKNGVYTLNGALYPEQDNIAKQMQAGGYQTALIGKWHLKKQPSGFDYFEVFHDQGEYINPIFKTKENWVENENVGNQVEGFSTDIVTDKTIQWIRQRDKTKPFMMCCHFKATHEPYDFPERNRHLYDGVVFPEPENLLDFGKTASGRTFEGQPLENLAKRWETATETGKWWCQYPELPFKREGKDSISDRRQIYQKLVKDYLRCAATIDQNIGRLMDFLKEEGLEQNTIVVYVADQGYFLGEHGFFDKRMMLEESLRMPFVIRYPKEIPAGTRNKDIILNIDFASLLADYAGVKVPELSQGRSFRENLKGKTPADWRKNMYYRYWTNETGSPERPAHLGIRNDRYKLMYMYGSTMIGKGDTRLEQNDIKSPASNWEFYDLQKDPKENHNVYHDPAYADIIKEMKNELISLRKEYQDDNDGLSIK